jgi:hypothetical protein
MPQGLQQARLFGMGFPQPKRGGSLLRILNIAAQPIKLPNSLFLCDQRKMDDLAFWLPCRRLNLMARPDSITRSILAI